MSKIDLQGFRNVIREEVRKVFQEELAGILKEAVMSNRTQQPIVETANAKPRVPSTLNISGAPRLTPPVLSNGNPLNNLLAETAKSMSAQDFESLQGIQASNADVPVVESVNAMFNTARKSSNLEAIEINAVPDFTGLMSKMMANGEV